MLCTDFKVDVSAFWEVQEGMILKANSTSQEGFRERKALS